ncbi:MAG: hypothetical protein IT356_12270 [Gemmatimonadaceae bacterium]|nr:hypothetical protein [Gemmatimonadaceae bacterium]
MTALHALRWAVLAMAAASAAACGPNGANDGTVQEPARPATAQSPEAYRLRQARVADSLLRDAMPASGLVRQLGAGFAVAPAPLARELARLAGSAGCFDEGRKADPYLAGAVSLQVSASDTGTVVIRVLESGTSWTSAAGNVVNSCLTVAASGWKIRQGVARGLAYVAQVEFR